MGRVMAVQPGRVGVVADVLRHLQPVAGYFLNRDVLKPPRECRAIPPCQQRRGLRPDVSEDQPLFFLNRKRLEFDLFLESAFRRFGGLRRALTGDVVAPSMIGATKPLGHDVTKLKLDLAMRATGLDQAELSLFITKQYVILAQ